MRLSPHASTLIVGDVRPRDETDGLEWATPLPWSRLSIAQHLVETAGVHLCHLRWWRSEADRTVRRLARFQRQWLPSVHRVILIGPESHVGRPETFLGLPCFRVPPPAFWDDEYVRRMRL